MAYTGYGSVSLCAREVCQQTFNPNYFINEKKICVLGIVCEILPNSSDVFVFVGFTSLKNIEHQRENMHVANMHKEESIMHRCTNSIASKSLFENCESTQFHSRDAGHFKTF